MLLALVFASLSFSRVSTRDAKDPVAVLRNFLDALETQNLNSVKSNLTTADLHVYEQDQSLDKATWIRSMQKFFGNYTGAWRILNPIVSTDVNSAHVYYQDHGIFTSKSTGEQTTHKWIESVYMIEQDGFLRIKFISSAKAAENPWHP